MKSFRSCFTIIDFLIMIALACILIGMLLPAANTMCASDKDVEMKLSSQSYIVVTEAYRASLTSADRCIEMQNAADRFNKKVDSYLQQGYRLHGRIVTDDHCFIQAMVK